MWCRKAKKAHHETEEKQVCVYTKDATDGDEGGNYACTYKTLHTKRSWDFSKHFSITCWSEKSLFAHHGFYKKKTCQEVSMPPTCNMQIIAHMTV